MAILSERALSFPELSVQDRLTQMLIRLEAEQIISAGKYARSPNRSAHRNGCR